MKSSTLKRSTLSKETIAVIENLASNNPETPVEFVRPEELMPKMTIAEKEKRSKEIDLLWQNFKTIQFRSKSPFAYVSMGFIFGVIVTLLIVGGITYYSSKNPSNIKSQIKIDKIKIFDNENVSENDKKPVVNIPTDKDNSPKVEKKQEHNNSNINDGEKNEVASQGQKYFVKEGDTGVGIIKNHYGKYSVEMEDKVKQVNNLESLDKIYIGQELILP